MSSRTVQPRSQVAPLVANAVDGTAAAPTGVQTSILDVLNPSTNAQFDEGAPTQFEVQPHMMFMLASIIFSVIKTVPQSEYAHNAMLSPASLVGYCLSLVFAAAFHFDNSHRVSPSLQAQEIENDANASKFYASMLHLAVPPFMIPILEAIQTFLPDGTTNLMYVTSFAASSLLHDAGTIVPSNAFFLLHNLMASLPANTSQADLEYAYNRSLIATLFDGQGVAFPLHPSQLFGSGTAGQASDNWIYQRVRSLVNSLSIRPVHMGVSVATLPFTSHTYANAAAFNAYNYGTSYSPDNAYMLSSGMLSLSQSVKSLFTASLPLNGYITTGKHSLARHLILGTSLPTFLPRPALTADLTAAQNPYRPLAARQTPADVAAEIHFLEDAPEPTSALPANNGTNEMALKRDPATPPTQSPYYADLVEQTQTPANTPDPVTWLHFSADRHVTPDMVIYDPHFTTLAATATCQIAGIVTIPDSVTGIIVHLPPPETSPYMLNSYHVQGAIPIASTAHAWQFNNVRLPAPDFPTQFTLPQLFKTGYASALTLPKFRQGFVRLSATVNNLFWRIFPAVSFQRYARTDVDNINIFGRALNAPLLRTDGEIRLWSSYRYVNPTTNSINVLPSLKPIYGSSARSFRVAHISKRLPF